jgi:hypothetical protein
VRCFDAGGFWVNFNFKIEEKDMRIWREFRAICALENVTAKEKVMQLLRECVAESKKNAK